jgi:hypothetical protein
MKNQGNWKNAHGNISISTVCSAAGHKKLIKYYTTNKFLFKCVSIAFLLSLVFDTT